MSAGSGPGHPLIGFLVVVPAHFNPTPGQLRGRPIPRQLLDGVQQELLQHWPFGMVLPGRGWSTYPDPDNPGATITRMEPQLHFMVDVALGDAADDWDWCAARCPIWAERLQQREIGVRISAPGGIYWFTFAPPNAPWAVPQVNPFRPRGLMP